MDGRDSLEWVVFEHAKSWACQPLQGSLASATITSSNKVLFSYLLISTAYRFCFLHIWLLINLKCIPKGQDQNCNWLHVAMAPMYRRMPLRLDTWERQFAVPIRHRLVKRAVAPKGVTLVQSCLSSPFSLLSPLPLMHFSVHCQVKQQRGK